MKDASVQVGENYDLPEKKDAQVYVNLNEMEVVKHGSESDGFAAREEQKQAIIDIDSLSQDIKSLADSISRNGRE